MKLTRAVLLSTLVSAGLLGTDVSVSYGTQSPSGRVPKEPPSTTSVVHGATSLSVTTTTLAEVTTASAATNTERVLTAKYTYNERSPRVRKLQRTIGTAVVDGHYGPKTRSKHIAKLQAMGLSRANVPSNKPVPTYNISYNPERRCPTFEQEFGRHGLHPVDVFSYIAWRESRCNPKSVNAIWKNGKIVWTLNNDGSYDSGLLQINSSWKTVTAQVCGSEFGDLTVLRNLDCNLKVAKHIMENSSGKLANWRVYRTN